MTSQQQADYALSIWQADRRIPHRERLRLIDEHSLNIIFDEQLRQVAYAMAEPPQRAIDKPAAAIWSVLLIADLGFIAAIAVLAWEIFRP